ncbi:MAG: hypothetical protein KKD73_04050 [Proteobacteria bacterium]|nr:hypothetical protein [Pseudomonadota bacterium]MBU1639706.1 hypothetical protein [Pseudomonadota bacterium]
MRPLAFSILFVFLVLSVSPVMAEYLQGTVVRIDHGKREIEMLIAENGQCRFENGTESVDKERQVPPGKTKNILVKAVWFPGCLTPGTQVYARGKYALDSKELFEADEVFPCRRRGGHDPTGVRSRFNHHRKQMMRQMDGGKP